jgi:hypothetical protein
MLRHRQIFGIRLVACVCAVHIASLATSAIASSPAKRVEVGEKLASCTFTDLRYLPRSLDDFVSKNDPVPIRAFVLVFTNTTCPLVQRYLPRLKQLDADFRKRGVQFVAIDVGGEDSMLEIATQAVEHDMPFPFVKDFDGSCVAACGLDRTATAVLIDADRKIRYRGRIDSRYRLSGSSPGVPKEELRDAIESLLAGEKIVVAETVVDGCLITKLVPPKSVGDVSYAKQIAPILDRNCKACHQPGTAAPFSFDDLDAVASNAAMIAEVVDQRRMPPWYASPGVGKFMNDRTMSSADRKLLVAWARAGAPHDDVGTTPTNVESVTSQEASHAAGIWASKTWQIGEPDYVLETPLTYDVPADGYVDYKYAVLPTLFLRDTYVEAVEIQPSNPRVVHHANLGFMPLGTDGKNAKLITGYVPGVGPMLLEHNVASKIPAGSAIGLQIHLVTTGKPEKTKLRVGFRFPRYEIDKELHYLQLSNQEFAIPPYAAHYPVSRTKTLRDDVTLYGFFAHMHVRGQDATFRAYPPDRDPVTLLMIPNYSFDWQMPYHLPYGAVKFPANTKFECLAHFDNTSFNPYNPDPSATVRDGQQTYQEMMYGYMFYTKDKEHLGLKIDVANGHAK